MQRKIIYLSIKLVNRSGFYNTVSQDGKSQLMVGDRQTYEQKKQYLLPKQS